MQKQARQLSSSPRLKLTNLHVKGTLECLKPAYWDLSPAMGLLYSASPSLLANTRQSKAGKFDLCRDLYFQRSVLGKRYGPVAIANSKSLPIKWLDTAQLGSIVGLSLAQYENQRNFDATYLDNHLKTQHILCNYVHDTWTGISFARYRKMISQITQSLHQQDYQRKLHSHSQIRSPFVAPNYSLLTLMQCVWERANNKEDLWLYFHALQQSSELDIFADKYQCVFDGISSSSEKTLWIQDQFSNDNLDSQLKQAWETITIRPTALISSQNPTSESLATSLELVAASLSVQAAFKSAIRQGRYTYTPQQLINTNNTNANITSKIDSEDANQFNSNNNIQNSSMNNSSIKLPARPDCVEVVIREIIDNLLYDTSTGKLDISLLPATSHRLLRDYYASYLAGDLTDIPHIANYSPSKTYTNSNYNNNNDKTRYDEAQNTTAGAAWFQLCSNLPRCDYLCHVHVASSGSPSEHKNNTNKNDHRSDNSNNSDNNGSNSNKESYELAPTLSNVCKTLGQLLAGPQTEWSRLEHVATFWNNHIDQIQSNNHNSTTSGNNSNSTYSAHKIKVQETRTMFRAPLSDTEMIYRDIGHIHVGNSPFVMQAELEPAHQLAAVKFIRAHQQNINNNTVSKMENHGTNNDSLWQQSDLLLDRLFPNRDNHSIDDNTTVYNNAINDGRMPSVHWRREISAVLQAILFPNIMAHPAIVNSRFPLSLQTSKVVTSNDNDNIIHDDSTKSDYGAQLSEIVSTFHHYEHLLLSGKYGEEQWKPAIVISTGEITITQSTMSLSLAAQAQAQYSTLIAQGLNCLVEMGELLNRYEALQNKDKNSSTAASKYRNDKASADVTNHDIAKNNSSSDNCSSMTANSCFDVTNSAGEKTVNARQKQSKKQRNNQPSRQENTANTTNSSCYTLQSLRSQWQDIALWYLTENHADISPYAMETFAMSQIALSTGTKQANEFLSSHFVPYLLLYRMQSDGGYLISLLSLLNKNGDNACSKERKKQILKDVVFTVRPQILLPNNTKTAIVLSWSQRWRLLSLCVFDK